MRRKLRHWRAYAAIVTGMVTLAGMATLTAAPAQAGTAGHAGVRPGSQRIGPPEAKGCERQREVGAGALHERRL